MKKDKSSHTLREIIYNNLYSIKLAFTLGGKNHPDKADYAAI